MVAADISCLCSSRLSYLSQYTAFTVLLCEILHFERAEKYSFLFLSCNRKHLLIQQTVSNLTTSHWGSSHARLSATRPANGNVSAWWHFRPFVKFSPQQCTLTTQSRGNGALRRGAGALGDDIAPLLVSTCLTVVYIYFGVQFRSWTYSLICIKRLVTVTLIEGRN